MSGRASSRCGFSSRSHLTTIASGSVRNAAKNLPRTFSDGRPHDIPSSTSGSSCASATTSSQRITAASLGDIDALDRDVLPRAIAPIGLERRDRVDDVHPVGDAAEHRVLAVEPWRRFGGDDEELAPVRVRAGVRHRECAAHDLVVVELVLELVAGPAAAGAGRVAALDHEVGDHAMEDDAVVEAVSGELQEVFDGVRGVVVEQLDRDRAVAGVQRRCRHVNGAYRRAARARRRSAAARPPRAPRRSPAAARAPRCPGRRRAPYSRRRGARRSRRARSSRCPGRGPGYTSRRASRFARGRPRRPGASRPARVGCGAGSRTPSLQRKPQPNPELPSVGTDRIVHFRPRTVFAVLGILIAVGVVLYVLWVARHVLSWLLISLFLALALNPAVDWLQRHGVPRRGLASGITFLVALGVIGGLLALFI